jgi:hypothetical protein
LFFSSDDSAPGAIPSLQKESNVAEESQDNPMKRYLQCPGMCRIEVLKKFVRNKYNVDTLPRKLLLGKDPGGARV